MEVPPSKSSISDAGHLMHNLSISPSMKFRRSCRNPLVPRSPFPDQPRLQDLRCLQMPLVPCKTFSLRRPRISPKEGSKQPKEYGCCIRHQRCPSPR
ncbi:CDP-alcohol phosphatidyltransferase [Histoplasma capsulatum var. duboisii H88]|uniref:CDP-alcohol phosphatidyltransferase n=1 Tax=Ajellomyces capsulatus (strain H88) TaxID=544711 RepID=A0A8A1L4J3_AJEC8|nr:CDP-alcohol phosphatidyltransferase [Histoplasma capsulatum var. duboisii H88]